MIDCPQCGNSIKGFRCSCGYQVTTRENGPIHRHRDKAKDDADLLAESRAWLIREGITQPEMTESERRKAMAAYRQRIAHEAPPDPLDWARRIMMRMEDGEYILPIQERMAKSALGIAL